MAEIPLRKESYFGALEKRLGYVFEDYSYLEKALTHTSVRKNAADKFHYEKLEFLGDRVLGLCVAEHLYFLFPDADEGELSLRLNALVNGNTLAEIADELELDEFIRTGADIKKIKGKQMRGVRADVVEAVIASIYLDGGLPAASAFVVRILADRIDNPETARRDSKTALQEWAHAHQLGSPIYREIGKSGPDHDPLFSVEVKVKGKLAGHGTGRTKRIAEQIAARQILECEGVWNSE